MSPKPTSVKTISCMRAGETIGPAPPGTQSDVLAAIGRRTSDEKNVDYIRVDTHERESHLDWMLRVYSARCPQEQNLEVIILSGAVFYRAIRDVLAEEELLVWYSEEVAQLIGLKELPYSKGDKQNICPFCGIFFKFPYPLRTHIYFYCKRLYEGAPINYSSISMAKADSEVLKVEEDSDEKFLATFPLIKKKNNSTNGKSDCSNNATLNDVSSTVSWNLKRKAEKPDEDPVKILKNRVSTDESDIKAIDCNENSIPRLSDVAVPKMPDTSTGVMTSAFKQVDRQRQRLQASPVAATGSVSPIAQSCRQLYQQSELAKSPGHKAIIPNSSLFSPSQKFYMGQLPDSLPMMHPQGSTSQALVRVNADIDIPVIGSNRGSMMSPTQWIAPINQTFLSSKQLGCTLDTLAARRALQAWLPQMWQPSRSTHRTGAPNAILTFG